MLGHALHRVEEEILGREGKVSKGTGERARKRNKEVGPLRDKQRVSEWSGGDTKRQMEPG